MRYSSITRRISGESVDAWSVVQQACAAVEPLAAETQRSLQVRFSELVPPVWADRDRLVQVLTNLLTNALKFTREDGEVAVEVSAADGECVFSVSDTGVGIPLADIDRVCDRVHQVPGNDPTDDKPTGSGLGLTICREIVERHGGKIWVESLVGHGTTFHFTIPTAPQPGAADAATGPPPSTDTPEPPRSTDLANIAPVAAASLQGHA
ncbi:MAG: HAMP domain-containing histidine kinase [Pseudomonadales bacterium]|nr:HAMP domain-containing histidine kinase [Pseudomonadales bacterium]